MASSRRSFLTMAAVATTVSTGDKQGISVAVQIVANDLQPNFVTANQAGIDYQLTRIPDFGDIEGSQARPFLGVNCFYVASSGKKIGRASCRERVCDLV